MSVHASQCVRQSAFVFVCGTWRAPRPQRQSGRRLAGAGVSAGARGCLPGTAPHAEQRKEQQDSGE